MADTLDSKPSAAMHEGSSPSFGTRIFIMTLQIKLNEKAEYAAVFNKNLFLRLEECMLNAKTDLAKRRLVRATVILSGIKAIDQETRDVIGWTQPS